MGEFVAGGADAAHLRSAVSPQLGGTEIFGQFYAVERAVGRRLVGPDGFFAGTCGFVVTGIIEQNHVDAAVSVRIIAGEVYFIVQQDAGFMQGLGSVVGLAVRGGGLGQLYGTVYIEDRTELTVGRLDVIIPHRACCAIVAVTGFVEHPGEPVKNSFLPYSMWYVFQYDMEYDFAYGEHFYDLSWNHGRKHEVILKAIEVPCVFLHAKEMPGPDGVNLSATTREQAERAVSFIGENCRLVETDTNDHVIHTVHSDVYIDAVNSLLV